MDHEEEEEDVLRRIVTIIIVTSPLESSNPSTELIDRCITSIFQTFPTLLGCKIVIAADGCEQQLTGDDDDNDNEVEEDEHDDHQDDHNGTDIYDAGHVTVAVGEEGDGDGNDDAEEEVVEPSTDDDGGQHGHATNARRSNNNIKSNKRNKRSIRSKRKRIFGKANVDTLRRYNEFLNKLEEEERRAWLVVDRPTPLSESSSNNSTPCTVDNLSTEWLGFALTLKKAMKNHVTTPIVFVSPHDYELIPSVLQQVNIQRLLDTILLSSSSSLSSSSRERKKPAVNYIGLANAKSVHSKKRHSTALQGIESIVLSKFDDDCDCNSTGSTTSRDYANHALDHENNNVDRRSLMITLEPLAMWKENPHFASVEAYWNIVFNNNPTTKHKFKRGHFIEDTLGQKMLQLLKSFDVPPAVTTTSSGTTTLASSHQQQQPLLRVQEGEVEDDGVVEDKQRFFDSHYGTYLLQIPKKQSSSSSATKTTATKVGNNGSEEMDALAGAASAVGRMSPPPQVRVQDVVVVGEVCTYHIDGGKFIDTKQRQLKGYQVKPFEIQHAKIAEEFVQQMNNRL